MKPKIKVFIFRRDFRIQDNIGLELLYQYDIDVPIVPIFIFHPEQIDPKKNVYYSSNCVQFMLECLKSLRSDTNDSLCFFHGNDIDIFEKLLHTFQIDAIGWNSDITPYAKKRDKQLETWCHQKNINAIKGEDYTLFPIGTILNGSKKAYEVFTPFYTTCITKLKNIKQVSIIHNKYTFFKAKSIKDIQCIKNIDIYLHEAYNTSIHSKGGRNEALDILFKIAKNQFVKYDKERDIPYENKTTGLSPYLKFGCISIREFYVCVLKTYGINHGLIREIIWREFYANITYHFPYILRGQIDTIGNEPFRRKYMDLKLYSASEKKYLWQAWCTGKTGFPIVDAGMRQLNATGWMHNRVRMIVSMFLIKDLLIDWRDGERYFAQKLIDYDPSSNNGGWQWSSSTGTDSQPYFRIFSPVLQAKRFDKNCDYIKKWIPELKSVHVKDILSWDTTYTKYQDSSYPKPIVDHSIQTKEAIALFKNI